jgi:spermidine synthase
VLFVAATGTADQATQLSPETPGFSPILRDKVNPAEVEFPPGSKTLYDEDSQYHHILVADSPVLPFGYTTSLPGHKMRAMRFDNSYQSALPTKDGKAVHDQRPVFDYVLALDLLAAYHPDLDRVLFLGLGAGTAPMRLRRLSPDTEIEVIEIDPDVVDVAEEYFAFDTDAIKTTVGDARTELASSDRRYDAIIVDAYYSDSIPFHLTTEEFVEIVGDHLTEDGVVAANIIGALEGEKSGLFRAMYKTYATEFDHLAAHSAHREKNQLDNIELFASRTELAPYDEVVAWAQEREDSGDHFLGGKKIVEIAKQRYQDKVETEDVPLLTDDYAPIDTLLRFGE